MTQPTMSAVIKAKNEAWQIAECVESARGFASEVIVVNDKSEDNTGRIATEMGAHVD